MKFIKSVSLISLLTLSINVIAAEEKTLLECGFPLAGEKFESNLKELLDVSTTPPEIPDYKCEDNFQRYAPLCLSLERQRQLDESDPSGLFYEYEKELARLAKADINKDGEELFIKKINKYVTTCSKIMICDTAVIKKEQIDMLKVAVAVRDWEFIERGVTIYKWPLNDIGPIDQMTILDFIYNDIEYYRSNRPNDSSVANLKKMYLLIKNAGGSHSKFKGSVSI
ncbi:MAG: hypothetical protein ACOVP4_04490 [Bacteriovoracaceae bacterium]